MKITIPRSIAIRATSGCQRCIWKRPCGAPPMLSKAFLILCFTFSVVTFAAGDCPKWKVRTHNGKNYVEQKWSFCLVQGRGHMNVISASCMKDNCRPLNISPRPLLRLPPPVMQIGTLGARICAGLGGVLELFDYFDEGSWHTADRCLFSNRNFVDSDYLSGLFKNHTIFD